MTSGDSQYDVVLVVDAGQPPRPVCGPATMLNTDLVAEDSRRAVAAQRSVAA